MFFVYSEFFALFLYNLKKVVFKGGVFMLSTVTGGQYCRNHRSKEKAD